MNNREKAAFELWKRFNRVTYNRSLEKVWSILPTATKEKYLSMVDMVIETMNKRSV